MKRFMLSLLLALGLMTAKSFAQERQWTLDASAEEAYLIFGVPDTEDVGISFWCPLKAGQVNLFLPQPTEELLKHKHKTLALTLRAGSETAKLTAKLDVREDGAASSAEVDIPLSHPILKALQEADRFEVKLADADIFFPLYDADVAGLLDFCRKT